MAQSISFDDMLAKLRENPEFAAEYDAMKPAKNFSVYKKNKKKRHVRVIETHGFVDDNGIDQVIAIVTCPHCNGIFGVDNTYLEQVDNHIYCSMCKLKVIIDEEDE